MSSWWFAFVTSNGIGGAGRRGDARSGAPLADPATAFHRPIGSRARVQQTVTKWNAGGAECRTAHRARLACGQRVAFVGARDEFLRRRDNFRHHTSPFEQALVRADVGWRAREVRPQESDLRPL